jgi:hypothetical protein
MIHQQGPSPVIILLPTASDVRNGFVRTLKRGKSIGKSKHLKPPPQPIPTFDRKRERVTRWLRETQHEREQFLNKRYQSRVSS